MNPFEEFKIITGSVLRKRNTNLLLDRVQRKDRLFDFLSFLYFSHHDKFVPLRSQIIGWTRLEPCETIYSLAGYIFYICEDFRKARHYFLKSLWLNLDNIDNWLDLAFSLRHGNDHFLSSAIIFHLDKMVYYSSYLNLKDQKCRFTTLKHFVRLVADKAGHHD